MAGASGDTWTVRPCTPADAAEVRRVWQAGLSQTYERHTGEERAKWERIFAQEAEKATGPSGDLYDPVGYWHRPGKGSILVAVNSATGTLGGCVAVKEGKCLEWGDADGSGGADTPHNASSGSGPCVCGVAEPGTASVWRMSVAAEARRQGIGTLLMQAVEAWAASHGFRAVQMMTANAAASAFYEAIGYGVFETDGPVNFHRKLLHPLLVVPAGHGGAAPAAAVAAAPASPPVSALPATKTRSPGGSGGGAGGGGGGGDAFFGPPLHCAMCPSLTNLP